jgi:aspartate carbamoyltransferase regulatory subunit
MPMMRKMEYVIDIVPIIHKILFNRGSDICSADVGIILLIIKMPKPRGNAKDIVATINDMSWSQRGIGRITLFHPSATRKYNKQNSPLDLLNRLSNSINIPNEIIKIKQ